MDRTDRPLRPNIIFIVADDLGYGELGCYGQRLIDTPNLDRMAREGMRFTQAYSGNTLCAPARCTLLTGQHTGHCLVRANIELPLRPQDVTIAEVLQEAGYRTGIVGKWGLGAEGSTGIPNRKGFDFFYGVLTHLQAHNYYPDFVYRNESKEKTRNELIRQNVAKVKLDYFPDLMTEEALQFIKSNGDRPYFLYLPYTLPHINNEQDLEHQNEVPSLGKYEEKPWTHANKGHAAMITYLDDLCGRLLKHLRESNDKNTLILFSADNGPLAVGGVDPYFFNSSGGLRGVKRDMYEGGMRVPLLAWWPGNTPEGTVSDRPVAFWDFLATFAELAGADMTSDTDGVSFAKDLRGLHNSQPPKPMYWEVYEGGFTQAVRIGNWKGIVKEQGAYVEVFDLSRDQREQNNLVDVRKDIVEQIKQYIKEARTPPVPGAVPTG